MVDGEDALPTASRLRRRLLIAAVGYLGVATVFGLLGIFGARAVASGIVAIGVPWAIAAVGALAGASAISVAALRARVAVADVRVDRVRLIKAVAVARGGRVLILLAAAGTVAASAALAPVRDDELGFVLGVNVGLAVVLALFALVADDVGRAIRRLPLVSLPRAEAE